MIRGLNWHMYMDGKSGTIRSIFMYTNQKVDELSDPRPLFQSLIALMSLAGLAILRAMDIEREARFINEAKTSVRRSQKPAGKEENKENLEARGPTTTPSPPVYDRTKRVEYAYYRFK